MQLSPIEWTDATSNPIYAVNKETGKRGHFCVKVSPGCLNCYAAAINTSARGFGNGLDYVEKNRDKVEFVLNAAELDAIRRRRKPTKIFLGDMTDLFQADIPDAYLDAVFATMALSPQHTFQILTKRPARMLAYLNEPNLVYRIADKGAELTQDKEVFYRLLSCEKPLPNVRMGVSAEDQQRADDRIPLLLQTPAAVRFVSYEPALGRVDFAKAVGSTNPYVVPHKFSWFVDRGIDWIIVGGESGAGARPFDVEWAHDVVAQCRAAGVACFVKQMGKNPVCSFAYLSIEQALEWPYIRAEHEGAAEQHRILLNDGHGADMAEWPADLRVRQFPEVGINAP